MKVPKNMTEQQVLDQITIVVDRIAPKYTFSGYEVNDIKQEAFIMCLEALERYDSKRPLENFLSVHLSNRLKNFVRDNFFTSKDDEAKKSIISPKQLSPDNCPTITYDNVDDHLDTHDMQNIIDKFLSPEHRSDYLKIINNVYVPKKRREEVIEIIKNILKEHGYEEG
jgi:DNA-directed RNA polymerase specialized sigma24 family protein